MILFTAEEFAEKICDVADNKKSIYSLGGWYPLGIYKRANGTEIDNKTRALNATPYNSYWHRRPFIVNASRDTFAFDCVNLFKHFLWGGSCNPFDVNGGAIYGSNGVPDTTETGIINGYCFDISTDFSKAPVGAFAWKKGHCGLVVAPGIAVESTPSTDSEGSPRRGYKDGVQYSRIGNYDVSGRTDLPVTTWEKWGKLVWLDYSGRKLKNGVYFEDGVARLYRRDQLVTEPGEHNIGGYHWIDDDGTVAINKEVHMPYVYNDEVPGSTDGKWTYFDGKGDMVYGFMKRNGNIYHYDPITGAMAHGDTELHVVLHFDPITGILTDIFNADASFDDGKEQGE